MVKLQPWQFIKSVFGYSDTGVARATVHPKSLKNLAMNLAVYGNDPLSTWYSRKIHLTQDRLQAYSEFENMDSCLTGNTKISLVDGTEVAIKDLVGRDPFWVYSYDHSTGRIVPGKGVARATRKNAELVEVTLDNGEAVKCTPDHRWMMRDGTYKEAKDLKPGDSLMPSTPAANHKVVSVAYLANREDCYDLDVETYHNFALTAGVFVHNSDIIVSCLDLYGEDSVPSDAITGKRIWVEAEDEEVEKICNELFTRINADEQAFPIAREIAKYGNSFGAIIQEQKKDGTPGQIIQVMPAPVYGVSRCEDENGRLTGFTVCPIEQMGSSAAGLASPSDLTKGNPTDPPWSFIHWRLLGKERLEAYGTSFLWGARLPYRRLFMAEDSLVTYRLKRSPDRFIFKIKGLSGMSPEDRARAMRTIRQELRKKHLIDKTSGQVRSEMEPVTPDEDLIIDDDSVSFERSAGSQQVNYVMDIEYLRKRFFGALKIPSDYLGFSDAKSGFISESPLSFQDVNFSRMCKRLQHATAAGFALICQINLCWVGIDPRSPKAKFVVHLNPVSLLDEKNRLELEKVRAETLDVLQKIGSDLGIDSDEWHAYLLQRSQIPVHLLRKSGKEPNDLLKGKVSIQEARKQSIDKMLKEDTRIVEETRKLVRNIFEGLIPLKSFRLDAKGQLVESVEQHKVIKLFSATLGPNKVQSHEVIDSVNPGMYPLSRSVNGKQLTEASVVTEWKTPEKKALIVAARNLMQETVARLKKEAAVSQERDRLIQLAEEKYGLSLEEMAVVDESDVIEEDDI